MQVTCNYLNRQATITTHHLPYPLDVELYPVCWMPLCNPLWTSCTTLKQICVIRWYLHILAEAFRVLVKEFSQTEPKVSALFIPQCLLLKTWKKRKSKAETLLHSLKRAATGIGLHVNADKTEYMCFNHTNNISTLNGSSLKLADKFSDLGSSVSSTETDIKRHRQQSIGYRPYGCLTDKVKNSFFQEAVVSILLYGCTTWTLTKRMEKKLDGNYTIMLRAILNKSWRQHPTKLQLYCHLTPLTNTIQVKRTRHAGRCWGSKDELISDILLWTPSHGGATAGETSGERGSRRSVLVVRHDDDDDDDDDQTIICKKENNGCRKQRIQ